MCDIGKPERIPEARTHLDDSQLKFGPFCLRNDGTLFRNGDEVRLPPKELALLRQLTTHAGQVVPFDQLRKAAWGKVHVSEESLPRCISSLRAHLGVEGCIQTVYKRGYRLQFEAATLHAVPDPLRIVVKEHRASVDPSRLAILPFQPSAGVPEILGMRGAEAIMLCMAQRRNAAMEVLARDSVFRLAARGISAREIGSVLGADLVLTGTICLLPLHYRFRTEMIRVADAVQLWVEDFLLPHNPAEDVDQRAAERIEGKMRSMNWVPWGSEDQEIASPVLRTSSGDSAA